MGDLIAGRINIAISGREDGPAVFLHHALSANMDMWRYQLPVLEQQFRSR